MTPVVETPRLLLRGRRLEDFPAYAAIWAEPEVVRFTTVKPQTREEAWLKFTRMEGLWSLCGYGFWIVEEKSSGRVIGEIGLADFKREIELSLDGMPEFGWVLSANTHGKGFAKEAVSAAIAWAEDRFPGTTFCCIIDPENAASANVAQAHGFRCVALAPYKGIDIAIFHRAPR